MGSKKSRMRMLVLLCVAMMFTNFVVALAGELAHTEMSDEVSSKDELKPHYSETRARALSDWQYQKDITITENSGSTLTDYQVRVNVDTASLISAGKLRSDCGDLRFVDANSSWLPYWIESGENTTNTTVWVKVPSIPASGETTIKMYYGNPSAASESNGTAVFEFFDDFEDYTLGPKFEFIQSGGTGSYELDPQNSSIKLNADGGDSTVILQNIDNISLRDVNVEMYAKWSRGANDNCLGLGCRWLATGVSLQSQDWYNQYAFSCDICSWVNTNLGAIDTDWHKYQLKRTGNTVSAYIDDSFKINHTESFPEDNLKVRMFLGRQAVVSAYIDHILVSKYADPEPTVTLGAETGLVALWHFDENTGTTAYDSSGNGNDGTIHGAAWTSGVNGSGLKFDGDDWVDLPSNIAPTQITLEAWIYPTGFDDSDGSPIITKEDGQGTSSGVAWKLIIKQNTHVLYFGVSNGPTEASARYGPILSNRWYHVAGTYDGSKINLYIDGILVNSTSFTGDLNTALLPTAIGHLKNFGVQWFKGIIDEARIYDRALSASEIQEHYAEYAPDLTLTSDDILFSNANPNVGESVTINATVRNVGYGESGMGNWETKAPIPTARHSFGI